MYCHELVLLIHSLSSNKACGPDGVGAQLIKDNCNLFAICFFLELLISLFNLSLLKGVVPDSLKARPLELDLVTILLIHRSGQAP